MVQKRNEGDWNRLKKTYNANTDMSELCALENTKNEKKMAVK
jgi:hypothetical protein